MNGKIKRNFWKFRFVVYSRCSCCRSVFLSLFVSFIISTVFVFLLRWLRVLKSFFRFRVVGFCCGGLVMFSFVRIFRIFFVYIFFR